MSIIAVFTACGWKDPDSLYYEYYNTIILIKNNIPIDTLHDNFEIHILDYDHRPKNFESDTFYFSKEYILKLDSEQYYEKRSIYYFNDSTLSERLASSMNYYYDLQASFSSSENEAIKASDCDSIAVSYSGFSEHYTN